MKYHLQGGRVAELSPSPLQALKKHTCDIQDWYWNFTPAEKYISMLPGQSSFSTAHQTGCNLVMLPSWVSAINKLKPKLSWPTWKLKIQHWCHVCAHRTNSVHLRCKCSLLISSACHKESVSVWHILLMLGVTAACLQQECHICILQPTPQHTSVN